MGLIFGCEYFPISHFSIGGEANFNYTSYGNPVVTETDVPPTQNSSLYTVDRKFHSFHTDGIILLDGIFFNIYDYLLNRRIP